MRISKTFGERKQVLLSNNPKKKYFFAYEGRETERTYVSDSKPGALYKRHYANH